MWCRVQWVVLWSVWAARLVPHHAPLVRVRQGALRGLLSPDGRHYQYLGIPYATSSQQHRFKAPGPPPSWEGVFEAVDEHVRCPQRLGGGLVLGREDCLVLNVYRPLHSRSDGLLPVMVFIHGGAFREGAGARLLYGPEYLVLHGVLLVTLNYRLDALGFLCLQTKEAPGNAGLKDQAAALKWVQHNIRAFGGDPDNVTLFGESAGGTSVSYHLLSNMTRGLFHKAIIRKEKKRKSSVAPWARQREPQQVAISLAKALGYNVDDPSDLYHTLMNETFSKLVLASIPQKEGQLKFLHFPHRPCTELLIDGVDPFLTDIPYNILTKGNFNKVPVIIGANNQEGYFFAAEDDEESLSNMKFEECLPDDLNFPSLAERQAAAQQMRRLYMGDEEVSWSTIERLSKLHGESQFNYPVLVETELLREANTQPVYSYLFEHDGWRNFPKLTSGVKFWMADGATHADDLFYLFSLFPIPNIFENHMVTMMTTLWTNFAKYGEPGLADDVRWKKHIRLNVKPSIEQYVAMPPQRLNFWRALYHKYRAT